MNISYVNPSGRDLIKQLSAIGVGLSTGLIRLPVALAKESESVSAGLPGNATWRKDEHSEDLRRSMLWKYNTSERYSDVIVQATTETDISAALEFVAKNDLQVVVRIT